MLHESPHLLHSTPAPGGGRTANASRRREPKRSEEERRSRGGSQRDDVAGRETGEVTTGEAGTAFDRLTPPSPLRAWEGTPEQGRKSCCPGSIFRRLARARATRYPSSGVRGKSRVALRGAQRQAGEADWRKASPARPPGRKIPVRAPATSAASEIPSAATVASYRISLECSQILPGGTL